MSITTVVVPSGATLEIVTDGSTSGFYREMNPTFPKVTLPINSDVIIPIRQGQVQYQIWILVGTGVTITVTPAPADLATEVSRAETAEALLAPKASPTFTGTVTLPSSWVIPGVQALPESPDTLTDIANNASGTAIATAVNNINTILIAAGLAIAP